MDMKERARKEAADILAVCNAYGYGNVMEWASAFYRYYLKQKGLPASHASIPVVPLLCNENDEGIKIGASTRDLYDSMVEDIMGENE